VRRSSGIGIRHSGLGVVDDEAECPEKLSRHDAPLICAAPCCDAADGGGDAWLVASAPPAVTQLGGYRGGVLGQDLGSVEREEHYARALRLEDGPGHGRLLLDLDEARNVGQILHPREGGRCTVTHGAAEI